MGTGDGGQMTRRDLLGGAGVGLVGLRAGIAPGRPVAPGRAPRAAILLLMVGGPSPRETFDPRPDAPASGRGPFGSIATAVPGARVVEHLPEVARRLGRLTLIRSLHHDADPTHEAGLRLLLTGRAGPGAPALGSVAARDLGARGGMPPYVVLPATIGAVGGRDRLDRTLGTLGPAFEPFVVGRDAGLGRVATGAVLDRARAWADRAASRGLATAAERPADDRLDRRPGADDRPGASEFGRNCRLAARLVAAGSRLVVVPTSAGVFGGASWDAHGRSPFGHWDDYARTLLPAFDRGFAGLVDDLDGRGLLDSTLVAAVGEFGRTPRINESGGRDHWPAVMSALLAGGGAPGGLVLGASTDDGQPADRPVPLVDLVATLAAATGLDPSAWAAEVGVAARPIGEVMG